MSKLAFVMAIHISLLQQFVGINVVIAYGPHVMEQVLPSMKAVIPIIINLLPVIAVAPTIILLKKFGRKTMMQAGTVICGSSLGLISLGFFLN